MLNFSRRVALDITLLTGADPGFFLGGASLRNDVTDGEVKNFKSEYVYAKKKASSQGGEGVRTPCTLPLDPPLFNPWVGSGSLRVISLAHDYSSMTVGGG